MIFLIGPRACGKTTVGKLLAAKRGLAFVDCDRVMQVRLGESIADFVARRGWDAFRDFEAEILAELTGLGDQVVATGGGAVLRPENRRRMREAGTVFYLQADADTLAARLALDPLHEQRPSLTDASLVDEAAQVLCERESLYRETAHHVVSAELAAEAMLDIIETCLEHA